MGLLDLFKPKWKNSNPSIRIKAVQELTNESIIEQLALSDIDEMVRYHATNKITNQEIITSIALSDKDEDVRYVATERILYNESALIKIALSDDSSKVRQEAVEKIENQVRGTGLVYKESNQDIFNQIATTDKDYQVRLSALGKITNHKILTELAVSSSFSCVREFATKKISNQELLAKIALEDEDSDVRKIATERLENQNILENIALEEFNEDVALAALQKINTQSSIAKIALHAETNSVKEAALGRIDNKQVNNKLVLSTLDWNIRKEIINDIDDEFVLAQIIQTNKPNTFLHSNAMKKIYTEADYFKCKDQELEIIEKVKSITNLDELYEIAQKHILVKVRNEAILNINHQKKLTEIAKNEIVYELRLAAIKKLTDLNTLSEIGLKDWDVQMRREVFQIVLELLFAKNKIDEVSDHLPKETVNLILKSLDINTISSITKESFLPFLVKSSNPEVFHAIFNWLLNTFHPLSKSTITLLKNFCSDYVDIIIDLRTYVEQVENHEGTWSSDCGGAWKNEYYSYDEKLMERATKKLCEIKTPVSSNLLHLITKRKSISITLSVVCMHTSKGDLNWQTQREIANHELKLRGNPTYDPKIYLEPKAW